MENIQHFIVVDDDSVNNLICEFSIQGHSSAASISLYTDPEIALEAIKTAYCLPHEAKQTVLFLDINMPLMSGWDFLGLFATFSPEIKNQFTIYILSSSIAEDDIRKAKENPYVSGFVSKPLTTKNVSRLLSQESELFKNLAD